MRGNIRVQVFVALILLSYLRCFSQGDTTVVPFVSYWSIGDRYDFQVTKVKQQWKNGQLVKNDSSSYITNFRIIDSTENSYKISWSYKINLNEFNLTKKLYDLFSNYQLTELIYVTDELGEFVEIENWKEVSELMIGLIDQISNSLSEKESENQVDVKQVMQPFYDIYASKDGIEQLVFKELHYFHFPFGLEYSVTEPIEYKEQLPNILGGDPIRGDAKLYFETVDFENEHCVLIQEMQLNPDDTKSTLTTLFEQMGLKDQEMEDVLSTAKLDITDYNRYEYFYYPGIPIKIETRRESIIDIAKEKGKRIDRVIIELIR